MRTIMRKRLLFKIIGYTPPPFRRINRLKIVRKLLVLYWFPHVAIVTHLRNQSPPISVTNAVHPNCSRLLRLCCLSGLLGSALFLTGDMLFYGSWCDHQCVFIVAPRVCGPPFAPSSHLWSITARPELAAMIGSTVITSPSVRRNSLAWSS